MYVRADDWRSAHRVAVDCMPPEEIRELYVSQVTPHKHTHIHTHTHTQRYAHAITRAHAHTQAGEMEREGRVMEAEQLYLLVNEPDMAISMYKKAKQVDPHTLKNLPNSPC